MKILKSLSRAYEAIIEAFKQDDPKKLQAEAFEGQEIWQQVQAQMKLCCRRSQLMVRRMAILASSGRS